MKSLLIGESASPEVQRMVVDALEAGPELARVIHMRTVHISPDSILVAAKVEVRDADTTAQVAAAIDTAERRVRSAVPIAKVIYLEPDIYRPAKADESDPAIRSVRRSQAPVPPSADGPPSAAGPRNPSNPENPAPQPSPPE
jgi:divalent metal cation (Fe/Co/Zn/Cd) transporter